MDSPEPLAARFADPNLSSRDYCCECGKTIGMESTNEPVKAGDGLTDEEMVEQVADQTSTDLKYADVFQRESDGTLTDTEAAKADADELAPDR